MLFPLSIRNLFYTWTSLRPWTQSLIIGIPLWPMIPIICLFGWAANALPSEWYGTALTSLFIIMWYGAVWAMGQQDIRNLTFKSGRAWFIAAIIIYLAGMAPILVALPLLLVGAYLVFQWDSIIAAKKWRYAAMGIGAIIAALVLNGLYPSKFVLTDIAWALPVFVVLLAPKQVDKFISWVYSAISLGVVGFIAIGAAAKSVPEQYQPALITAVLVITVGAILWMRKSARGRLMKEAHQEKKAAAANSPTARKLRRWMFIIVMILYVILHGILVMGFRDGSIGSIAVALASAGFVYAVWHRLNVYDQHHIAAQEANSL